MTCSVAPPAGGVTPIIPRILMGMEFPPRYACQSFVTRNKRENELYVKSRASNPESSMVLIFPRCRAVVLSTGRDKYAPSSQLTEVQRYSIPAQTPRQREEWNHAWPSTPVSDCLE